jgi:hypothetical protein
MGDADSIGTGSDRRGFLLGAAGALLAAGAARAGSGPATAAEDGARRLNLVDPAAAFNAMLRLQGRLDGRDAPWWYFGRIYGIVGDGAPRLLVRFEGLEIMRLTPSGPSEYAATGVTTSFFQDPVTKAVLETFANPYTGKTNTVTPNQLGGTADPVTFYSPQGVRPARVKPEDWRYDGQALTWDFHDETVWLSHDRVYPPGLPQPMGESSVARARIADLADPGRAFVPAGFSSTYFAPWPRWMEMAGQPGHVIWHADGVKLDSVAGLPRWFRERMEAQFPARLQALPFVPAGAPPRS